MATRERIREQYLHGELFSQGDRMAEAIRHYAGEWSVYRYVDGVMLRADRGEQRKLEISPPRVPYGLAIRAARLFAEGGAP